MCGMLYFKRHNYRLLCTYPSTRYITHTPHVHDVRVAQNFYQITHGSTLNAYRFRSEKYMDVEQMSRI